MTQYNTISDYQRKPAQTQTTTTTATHGLVLLTEAQQNHQNGRKFSASDVEVAAKSGVEASEIFA